MKKVSQKQLGQLKKKGKVRRKMGAQPAKEPLEPESLATEDMSGSERIEPAPAPEPPPPTPAVDSEPMASMAASMAYRDTMLEQLIRENTTTIQSFRDELARQKPKAGVAYRHKVKRVEGRIDEVISTPLEGKNVS